MLWHAGQTEWYHSTFLYFFIPALYHAIASIVFFSSSTVGTFRRTRDIFELAIFEQCKERVCMYVYVFMFSVRDVGTRARKGNARLGISSPRGRFATLAERRSMIKISMSLSRSLKDYKLEWAFFVACSRLSGASCVGHRPVPAALSLLQSAKSKTSCSPFKSSFVTTNCVKFRLSRPGTVGKLLGRFCPPGPETSGVLEGGMAMDVSHQVGKELRSSRGNLVSSVVPELRNADIEYWRRV